MIMCVHNSLAIFVDEIKRIECSQEYVLHLNCLSFSDILQSSIFHLNSYENTHVLICVFILGTFEFINSFTHENHQMINNHVGISI